MKKPLRHWAAVVVGATAAFAFTSCTYDPAYTSISGSYGTGYGEGYGYGNSNFSTSVFVTTGDPRWGYDPYNYSYYDYHRRCYYDPYLDGYYPIGYRPPVIYGAPHPHGWRPGHGYCPPPRVVNNVTIHNYRNREAAYRNTRHDWARQVRQQPVNHGREQGKRPENHGTRPWGGTRPQNHDGNVNRQESGTRPNGRQPYRQDSGWGNKPEAKPNRKPERNPQSGGNRYPSGYNTPVTRPSPDSGMPSQWKKPARNTQREPQQQNLQPNKNRNSPNRNMENPQRNAPNPGKRFGESPRKEPQSRPNKEEKTKLRSLGEG